MALLHMSPRRAPKQNPVLVLDCLEERCVLSNVLGSFAMPWLRLCPLIVSHRLSRMLPVRAISPLSTPL